MRMPFLLAVGLMVIAVTVMPAAASGEKLVPIESVPFSWMPSGVRTQMLAQAPLAVAANRIQQAVDRAPAAGYAGVVLDGDHLTLWWKGAPPAAVRNAIAEVRPTVDVRVAQAAHSRAELVAAGKRIGTYIRANPGLPYHGVEAAYDGSGLIIDAVPAGGRLAAATAELPVSIPDGIHVSVSEKTPPTLNGRWDDSAPYWSGGIMQNNDNNNACTAGWPVVANGGNYMLIAGHCGRPGGGWNNGNDSRFFGTGATENVDHDVMLVSASVGGYMLDGGVGSGEFAKGISGWAQAVPGEYLCTSGVASGAICNFKTSSSFQITGCFKDTYGNYECHSDLVLATQVDGLQASRDGDSGGPVFGLSGSTRVIAKGTITGHNGNQLIFQDFFTAIRDLGITSIYTVP